MFLLPAFGILLIILGLLFAGQDAGIIPVPQPSFMVGTTDWVFYGLLLAGAGLALVLMGGRRH